MFLPVVHVVVLSATCRVATDCYPLVWVLFGTVGHYIGDEDDYFSDYSPCSFWYLGPWVIILATRMTTLAITPLVLSGSASEVAEQWKRWQHSFTYYVDGKGIIDALRKKFVISFSRSRRAGIIWRFSWPWCSSWTSGWWWSVQESSSHAQHAFRGYPKHSLWTSLVSPDIFPRWRDLWPLCCTIETAGAPLWFRPGSRRFHQGSTNW